MLPSSGTELAIVNVTIENQGYDTFAANKNYFSAVVNGVTYNYDSSCSANDLLPDTNIVNGDKATGNITYILPEPTLDFTMQYNGPVKYNINWIKR